MRCLARCVVLSLPTLLMTALASCDSIAESKTGSATTSPTVVVKSPDQQRREKLLLDVAREYRSFGVVDDMTRWAPAMCAAAPAAPPARFSRSDDASTHGGK